MTERNVPCLFSRKKIIRREILPWTASLQKFETLTKIKKHVIDLIASFGKAKGSNCEDQFFLCILRDTIRCSCLLNKTDDKKLLSS